MASPQQPEIGRSGHTDLDPDHTREVLEAHPRPDEQGNTGPVPEENVPGHRPAHDEDKPDGAAVAERLGVRADPSGAEAEDADASGERDEGDGAQRS